MISDEPDAGIVVFIQANLPRGELVIRFPLDDDIVFTEELAYMTFADIRDTVIEAIQGKEFSADGS